jgi:hypothetical protein
MAKCQTSAGTAGIRHLPFDRLEPVIPPGGSDHSGYGSLGVDAQPVFDSFGYRKFDSHICIRERFDAQGACGHFW